MPEKAILGWIIIELNYSTVYWQLNLATTALQMLTFQVQQHCMIYITLFKVDTMHLHFLSRPAMVSSMTSKPIILFGCQPAQCNMGPMLTGTS